VCPFSGLLYDLHFAVIFDDVKNMVARCFHNLVTNDNFNCQTPLKNAKFDLFGSENASWEIWLRIQFD